MANQYQNFSNPTITPDQPTGWQAANQSMSGLISHASDYLMQQQQKVQDLQLQQAQDLSKFKTLDQVYYGGAYSQKLDSLLSQNPYGRHLIGPRSSLSNAGQPDSPMTGNPNVGAAMIGAPGASMYGTGMFPMNSPTTGGAPSGGGSMSSVNPVSSGPVVTGGTQKAFEPPSMNFANPAGEAQVQQAKSQAEANVAVPTQYAKDIVSKKASEDAAAASLDGITKNLAADIKASQIESGGGGPFMGNIAKLSTHVGMAPATYGLENTLRDSSVAYARTLANGSQGVQKLFQSVMESMPGAAATPQQSGTALLQMHLTAKQLQAGMDSLGMTPKDMENKTPEQIQVILSAGAGTIDRSAETQNFSKILASIQPTKVMDMNGSISEPRPIFGGGKASGGATGSFSGFMNPVTQSKPQPKQQNNIASNFTRQEILEELQRRRNLKDIQSNISQ